MNTSSSAWVGCSCLPSPALITAASVQPATSCGGAGVGRADHDRGRVVCRQRLHRVLSDSPLSTLEPAERMLTTSALTGAWRPARTTRAGARRGLVEEVDDGAAAQRRDLLDLAAGDLGERLGAVEDPLDPGAVEVVDRDQVAGSVVMRAPSWRSVGGADRDLVDAVDLLDAHVDALVLRGRQVLADVVGADRQLAVAAVDEHRELDAGRAAEVEERVDRRAHRAPGVEHVVDDHDRAAVDREVELGGVDDRRCAGPDARDRRGRRRCRRVPSGTGGSSSSLGQRVQALGEDRAAAMDPDEREPSPTSGFFSTISWAIRTSVRRMSSRSRTTVWVPTLLLPGLTGPG